MVLSKVLRGCFRSFLIHPRSLSLYCHQYMCFCLLSASSIDCFQYLFMFSLLTIKLKRTDKNKETKVWEKREATGKRVIGENIFTTGFREPKNFFCPRMSVIWKGQVSLSCHWLCSLRGHFMHKALGDGNEVPSYNFYGVYLYFNMLTKLCSSLQCLFIQSVA